MDLKKKKYIISFVLCLLIIYNHVHVLTSSVQIKFDMVFVLLTDVLIIAVPQRTINTTYIDLFKTL